MINGSTCVDSPFINHAFFLYQDRKGILSGWVSRLRSEVLNASHGKGVTKGQVLRRKHPQFHGHIRVQ